MICQNQKTAQSLSFHVTAGLEILCYYHKTTRLPQDSDENQSSSSNEPSLRLAVDNLDDSVEIDCENFKSEVESEIDEKNENS